MPESPDSAGLDPTRLLIWSSIATLLERLPAALDAQLQQDSGMTHFEFGVLYALDTAPERTLRLSVLAGYASCTLSRLSRAISRLETRGWVRRTVDPSDGRFTLATLSDDGHAKVVQASPGHEALVDRLVFHVLTPAQARQLGAASRLISAAIAPQPTWTPSSEQNQAPSE